MNGIGDVALVEQHNQQNFLDNKRQGHSVNRTYNYKGKRQKCLGMCASFLVYRTKQVKKKTHFSFLLPYNI